MTTRYDVALLFVLLTLNAMSTATAEPVAIGPIQIASDPPACVESSMPAPPAGAKRFAVSQVTAMSYQWPLDRPLGDGLILVNYVDDDPLTGSVRDYQGLPHSYDGHGGTDITLGSFRKMDRGVWVLSAGAGTVVQSVDGNDDRNMQPPYGPANYVLIQNPDATYVYYFHFRRNSILVQPGDIVKVGTPLGLAGSSGNSTDAHLHFEPGVFSGSGWQNRDPWNGPNNPLPSLWASQLPYAGTQPLECADMGVATQASAGGNLAAIPASAYKERMSQPAVFGSTEPAVMVWLQLQAKAGDSYRLEIRRPNNSLYAARDYTLPSKLAYGWHYWYWSWNGLVGPADYGTWTARLMVGATQLRSVTFDVGAATRFGPRFLPRAGRSYKLTSTIQADTLRTSPLGGPVTRRLVGAPAAAALLQDSILVVPAHYGQPLRSATFAVVAEDAFALSDTFWVHLVEPNAPIEPPLAVPPSAGPAAKRMLWLASGNPSRTAFQLRFSVPGKGPVRIGVFDAAGRRLRTLFEGAAIEGESSLVWDRRDNAGHVAPAGLYFVRLETSGVRTDLPVVSLP